MNAKKAKKARLQLRRILVLTQGMPEDAKFQQYKGYWKQYKKQLKNST